MNHDEKLRKISLLKNKAFDQIKVKYARIQVLPFPNKAKLNITIYSYLQISSLFICYIKIHIKLIL